MNRDGFEPEVWPVQTAARLWGIAAFLCVLGESACGAGDPGQGTSGFGESGVLEEAGGVEESSDPLWWLSSGALFFRTGPVARTIQGELAPDSLWRIAYAEANPRDTDGGAHPQNLFRLVGRRTFQNSVQEVRFLVRRTHQSDSPNRNASNGVLLFQRYLDQDNLYVSGVRVDGAAVIKKKFQGENFTLAMQPLFGDGGPYDRQQNPTLLPQNRWVTIRTETRDLADAVQLRLFVDGDLVLETTDDGRGVEGPAFGAGLTGIRSDFMDVEFRGYRASPL